MPPTSVFVCGITQVDVSVHFTSSLLTMQSKLVQTPGVSVEFEFFTTVNEALTYFHKQGRFDVCVVIDGNMSVDPEFILQHDLTKPLVVASYPMKNIDWERVRSKITHATEQLSRVGMTYNYDPETATPEPGGVYVKLGGEGSKMQYPKYKIFKITKAAIDTLIDAHGDAVRDKNGSLLLYSDGILDGVYVSPDDRLTNLWSQPIYADISSKTINMGPFDYTGAVGNRKELR